MTYMEGIMALKKDKWTIRECDLPGGVLNTYYWVNRGNKRLFLTYISKGLMAQ